MKLWVGGTPVPKQSFRKTKNGNYIDPRVTAWEELIAYKTREAINLSGFEPIRHPVPVKVYLCFCLPTRRRVDLDNLSKAVLDGLKGVAFDDDDQVADLHITKQYVAKDHAGVTIIFGGVYETF